MSTEKVIKLLQEKNKELEAGFNYVWKVNPKSSRTRVSEKPKKSWPEFEFGKTPILKDRANWLYTELTFPKKRCGVPLEGTEMLISCGFWTPFTLYVDGVELFKEEHTWYASGPIADPFPVRIIPGKKYTIAYCAKPSDIPNNISGWMNVKSKPCLDIALELEAAAEQLVFAAELATSPAEKLLVEKAAEIIDLKALKNNDFGGVFSLIEKMEEILLPLSKKAKEVKLHALGHAHIDMDWMWTWKDTVHCIRRDFKSVVSVLRDYPEVKFSHSQVPTYQVIEKMDPDVFAEVKQLIAEGRWENTAATWVEGDLNMADGEAIARHFLYAREWTKEKLGTESVMMWEPDTFGHPPNIPQLARLGEVEGYFHMRCNRSTENWPLRNWKGIDGTGIKAFSTLYNNSLMPGALVNNALLAVRAGLKLGIHVWGIGNHGGALARQQLEFLKKFRNKPLIPTVVFSTGKELLSEIKKQKTVLKQNKGETFSLFEGCFTTHASIKRENRYCENALLTAETLSALAGIDRKEKLKDAWKPVLFSQFHDIFDGSSTHSPYADATERAKKAMKTADEVTKEAVAKLCTVRKGNSVIVVNPTGFSRTEPAALKLPAKTKCLIGSNGKIVPVQKYKGNFVFIAVDIPAFSKAVYKISKSAPKTGIRKINISAYRGFEGNDDTFKIETKLYSALLHKSSGIIGSYFDKKTGKEFVAQGMSKYLQHVRTTRTDLGLNVFQVVDESHNTMSAWNINEIKKEENLVSGAEVKLVSEGPVFAAFSVKNKFRKSKIEEVVIFYKDLNRVDFGINLDWKERGDAKGGTPQLKLAFAANIKAPRARFEGPYSVTERPASGTEQPTQKFVDVTGDDAGFTILNDSKYGCDVLGGRARMTLLRNPYSPDPETDNGRHLIKLAFIPHGEKIADSELIKNGTAFNRPLLAVTGSDDVKKYPAKINIEGAPSVICTSVKNAEYLNKTILRFFESSGRTCKAKVAFPGISKAVEVNFLERPTGKKIKKTGGKVLLSFKPYEVKSIIF